MLLQVRSKIPPAIGHYLYGPDPDYIKHSLKIEKPFYDESHPAYHSWKAFQPSVPITIFVSPDGDHARLCRRCSCEFGA